jgi:translation initiation factor 5A
MADVKLAPLGTLQKGRYIVIDGIACTVVENKHSKPGKHGSAKANITAVGLLDGKKRNIVGPASDNCEVPVITKKNAQILSISGDMANVMDMETFETFDMKVAEELADVVNVGAVVVYWTIMDDRVMKSLKTEGEATDGDYDG